MTLKRALVILFVCLFIAPFSEASSFAVGSQVERVSSERALRASRFVTVSGNRVDVLTVWTPAVAESGASSFGLEQAAFIRDWLSRQAKLGTLPPEMVRHETPPPLRPNGILPADLRERAQPLPPALERELPALSGNLRRVIVLGDVVLLEEDTSRIVDVIPAAF
jgi:hypothetical protein